LKRFAAIVTIAVVVLALSAGTAFASVCAGGSCGEAMVCPPSTSTACPMETGQVMTHSSCDHQADQGARDSVNPQVSHESAVVSTVLAVVPTTPILRGIVAAMAAPDARGAPHLTAVIRI
jgi:hypothetical protein